MKIVIKADGDGYLATVKDKYIDTYAWGNTKEEAANELVGIVEGIMDIRLEEIEHARKAKKLLLRQNKTCHAV